MLVAARLLGLLVIVLIGAHLTLLAGNLLLADTMGGDYTSFIPRLAYGYFWRVENGLTELPWYSPAWCGGLPFYADPQVMYFSIPQLLTIFGNPQQAVYWSFLLFSALGALGMYLYCRALGLSGALALLGCALFSLNEFYIARMAAGHFSYHMFPLIPLIAWLCIRAAGVISYRAYPPIVLAGLLIAYFVHGGALNFVVPAMLSVAGLLLVHAMVKGEFRSLWHFLQSGCLAILLSASKLAAGYAFVRHFPRESLSLGLFDGPADALYAIITMLFLNPWISLLPIEIDYAVMAHELRFGVSLVPLLLLFFGLAGLGAVVRKTSGASLAAFVMLLIVCALPVILSIKSPMIDALLKGLPYFREMSLAIRWLALLIPVIVVLSLLLFSQAVAQFTGKTATMFAITAGVLAYVLLGVSAAYFERPEDIYYDPAAMNNAWQKVQAGGAVPTVASIVAAKAGQKTFVGVDDALLDGGSSLICYQPLFGYSLQNYPIKQLLPGSVFTERAGKLNLKNPACYLFPEENNCAPGDHFTIAQQDQAARFATNQPFNWRMSWWQRLADWTSMLTLILSLLWFTISSLRSVFSGPMPRI